mmetsp:Transcript_81807/g.265012  ORF Transcript_81807/g.265012 Transcript_81807/m.265012 type:complete len:119 (-) Transcript_81807:140-496(-)
MVPRGALFDLPAIACPWSKVPVAFLRHGLYFVPQEEGRTERCRLRVGRQRWLMQWHLGDGVGRCSHHRPWSFAILKYVDRRTESPELERQGGLQLEMLSDNVKLTQSLASALIHDEMS